jgi:histidinol dehydrogenase
VVDLAKTNIKVINSSNLSEKNINEFIPRKISSFEEIKDDVLKIIDDVKSNGDKAILKYTEKFDKMLLQKDEIKVNKDEIEEAYRNIDEELLEALRFSKKKLIKFHKAQLREEWSINILRGVNAGQIFRPIEPVGIYVPGGRAIYPSTMLMAAAPAYVAGVKDLITCSPPQKNGRIAPEILVAANEFKIKKIFKVGGVQAIAAMAYGTETIPKVLKIVGPGNKWVNAAKQMLSNIVAIDNPAGPSEILIIADESADYRNVIMDFISQIEHDPDNIGIIISNSDELIEKVKQNLNSYIEAATRQKIIKSALKNSLIIQCKTLKECVRISNLIAPEHLEILTKTPRELIKEVSNAGAIFLGPYSPVSIGDYSAGTNHILPTGGYAKVYSGLNSIDFIKIIEVLECSQQGLKILSNSAIKIAEFEKLFAHKAAIEQRLEDKTIKQK